MREFLLGSCSFLTTFIAVESTGTQNSWLGLLIAILSALAFAAVNIISKIIISTLEKKGIITHEEAQHIEDKVDEGLKDLADDGKLNGSTDEDKIDK